MGVTYKLKQEVIDFIVKMKKDQSSLGCRKLADFASQEFDTYISKSSVNTVLKGANLSSSVGRRKINADTKKFLIPTEKKQQLLSNVKKNSFFNKKQDKASETVFVDVDKKDKQIVVYDNSNVAVVRKPLVPGTPPKIAPPLLGKQLISKEKANIDRVVGVKRSSGIEESLGVILLKATQWFYGIDTFMEDIFLNNDVISHYDKFYSNCSALILEQCLSADVEEQDNDSIDQRERNVSAKAQKLLPYLQNSKIDQKIVTDYIISKEVISLQVRGIKISLEDNSSLFFNVGISSFGRRLSEEHDVPLSFALDFMANRLICNNNPICVSLVKDQYSHDELIDFILFAEAVEGKNLCSVSLFDDQYESLAQFSTIPRVKRHFIIGAGVQQKEFNIWSKSSIWSKKQTYFSKSYNRNISFTETSTEGYVQKLKQISSKMRIITVFSEVEEKPCFAFLSNVEKLTSEHILEEYFSRRMGDLDILSNPIENQSRCVSKNTALMRANNASSILRDCTFMDIIKDFSCFLRDLCVKSFFAESTDIDSDFRLLLSFCQLSGYTDISDHRYKVVLILPNNCEYAEEIRAIIGNLNSRALFDSFGRSVIICLDTIDTF